MAGTALTFTGAPLRIPTWADPYYTQKVQLDGTDYILHFSYNQRTDRWSLAIHDESDTPLQQGLKLIANWPLLRHYHFKPELPSGELIVIDTTGKGSPPGLNDLAPDGRCQLIYQGLTTTPTPGQAVTIYYAISLTPGGGYVGDPAFVAAAANALNRYVQTLIQVVAGPRVLTLAAITSTIAATITELDLGVASFATTFALASPPTTTSNLTIGPAVLFAYLNVSVSSGS